MPTRKVAVALSGGLDSSVAALLLREGADQVIGIHGRLWDSHDFDYQAHRAKDICRILDIPYHEVDLRKEFASRVVDYFCQEYQRGRTPNPCVVCNQCIKFGTLLDKAGSLGVDYLATGHYSRVGHSCDGYHLLKATDSGRDQSYFLYTLTQERLGHVLFPTGEHSRDQAKQMAKQAGLPIATRSSQDICFISQKNYGAFLSQRFGALPGDIVDTLGRRLGEHRGIAFSTIGQRHGLGLASGKPLYVIKIEPEGNRIVLAPEDELYSQKLTVCKLNWVSGKVPCGPTMVRARIRYRSKEAQATVSVRDGSADVQFAQPQKAVTPGQAIVFYNVDEVLGGGIIDQVQTQK